MNLLFSIIYSFVCIHSPTYTHCYPSPATEVITRQLTGVKPPRTIMADERAPLLPGQAEETAEVIRQPPIWRRKKPVLWTLLIVVAGAVAAVAIYVLVRSGPHRGDDGVETRYPGESISWHPCGEVGKRPVECSTMDVPMDQFDEKRASNKTFSIPLIRRRGRDDATANILLNPGGPGGSGIDFMQRKGAELHKIVGDGFHLLSFDPRGIGASRPQALCFPDNDRRLELTPKLSGDPDLDAAFWGDIGNFVRACGDNMGEHGPHVNTPQTAADMNSILDAVGQEHLYYWGFSYGTALGQTYATLFPERSERVVIDGVVDDFLWYENRLLSTDFVDTDNAFAGFFDECVKAGDKCPLHGIAEDKKALQKNVTHFIEGLRENPMPVYINSSYFGTLGYQDVVPAVFSAMYKPAGWHPLASNLAKMMRGDGTAALEAWGGLGLNTSDAEPPGGGMREGNMFVEYNDAPAGTPAWPASKEGVLAIVRPYVERYMPWAGGNLAGYMGRAQWPLQKAHDFPAARHNVSTRHPLLVLSSTYDPICPLVNAKVARAAFAGARLVEVETYGHCSLAMPSRCNARIVRAFFADGSLPEERHTKCAAEGEYFVDPEKKDGDDEDGKMSTVGVDEDAELMEALWSLTDAIAPPPKPFF